MTETFQNIHEDKNLPNYDLIRYQDYFKNGKCLDLGCGNGRNTKILNELCKEIICVDSLDKNLDVIESKKYSKVKTIKSSIQDFSFEEKEYDLILISFVLMFISYEENLKLLQKLYSSLKEGGLLIVEVFNTDEPSFEPTKKAIYNDKDKFKHSFENFEQGKYSVKNPTTNFDFTYFDEKLMNILKEPYKIINETKSYKLDTSHGEPHYHGYFEFVGQKEK